MEVRVHNSYTARGYLEDDSVKLTLYWSTRLLRSIDSTQKYQAMAKALQELLWNDFRVLDANRNAISASGIPKLVRWADKHLPRLTSKYDHETRELKDAIRTLLDAARASDKPS